MNRTLLTLSAICMLALGTTLHAQEGGDRGGRGGRPRLDPAEMQARMLGHLKEQLQVGDKEWTVIEPRVKAVMDAQRAERELRGGRRMWGRDREQAPEIAAVEAALEKDDAEAIKTAVAALRAARAVRAAELKKAQESLREILTVSQEARLVLMGMLE